MAQEGPKIIGKDLIPKPTLSLDELRVMAPEEFLGVHCYTALRARGEGDGKVLTDFGKIDIRNIYNNLISKIDEILLIDEYRAKLNEEETGTKQQVHSKNLNTLIEEAAIKLKYNRNKNLSVIEKEKDNSWIIGGVIADNLIDYLNGKTFSVELPENSLTDLDRAREYSYKNFENIPAFLNTPELEKKDIIANLKSNNIEGKNFIENLIEEAKIILLRYVKDSNEIQTSVEEINQFKEKNDINKIIEILKGHVELKDIQAKINQISEKYAEINQNVTLLKNLYNENEEVDKQLEESQEKERIASSRVASTQSSLSHETQLAPTTPKSEEITPKHLPADLPTTPQIQESQSKIISTKPVEEMTAENDENDSTLLPQNVDKEKTLQSSVEPITTIGAPKSVSKEKIVEDEVEPEIEEDDEAESEIEEGETESEDVVAEDVGANEDLVTVLKNILKPIIPKGLTGLNDIQQLTEFVANLEDENIKNKFIKLIELGQKVQNEVDFEQFEKESREIIKLIDEFNSRTEPRAPLESQSRTQENLGSLPVHPVLDKFLKVLKSIENRGEILAEDLERLYYSALSEGVDNETRKGRRYQGEISNFELINAIYKKAVKKFQKKNIELSTKRKNEDFSKTETFPPIYSYDNFIEKRNIIKNEKDDVDNICERLNKTIDKPTYKYLLKRLNELESQYQGTHSINLISAAKKVVTSKQKMITANASEIRSLKEIIDHETKIFDGVMRLGLVQPESIQPEETPLKSQREEKVINKLTKILSQQLREYLAIYELNLIPSKNLKEFKENLTKLSGTLPDGSLKNILIQILKYEINLKVLSVIEDFEEIVKNAVNENELLEKFEEDEPSTPDKSKTQVFTIDSDEESEEDTPLEEPEKPKVIHVNKTDKKEIISKLEGLLRIFWERKLNDDTEKQDQVHITEILKRLNDPTVIQKIKELDYDKIKLQIKEVTDELIQQTNREIKSLRLQVNKLFEGLSSLQYKDQIEIRKDLNGILEKLKVIEKNAIAYHDFGNMFKKLDFEKNRVAQQIILIDKLKAEKEKRDKITIVNQTKVEKIEQPVQEVEQAEIKQLKHTLHSKFESEIYWGNDFITSLKSRIKSVPSDQENTEIIIKLVNDELTKVENLKDTIDNIKNDEDASELERNLLHFKNFINNKNEEIEKRKKDPIKFVIKEHEEVNNPTEQFPKRVEFTLEDLIKKIRDLEDENQRKASMIRGKINVLLKKTKKDKPKHQKLIEYIEQIEGISGKIIQGSVSYIDAEKRIDELNNVDKPSLERISNEVQEIAKTIATNEQIVRPLLDLNELSAAFKKVNELVYKAEKLKNSFEETDSQFHRANNIHENLLNIKSKKSADELLLTEVDELNNSIPTELTGLESDLKSLIANEKLKVLELRDNKKQAYQNLLSKANAELENSSQLNISIDGYIKALLGDEAINKLSLKELRNKKIKLADNSDVKFLESAFEQNKELENQKKEKLHIELEQLKNNMNDKIIRLENLVNKIENNSYSEKISQLKSFIPTDISPTISGRKNQILSLNKGIELCGSLEGQINEHLKKEREEKLRKINELNSLVEQILASKDRFTERMEKDRIAAYIPKIKQIADIYINKLQKITPTVLDPQLVDTLKLSAIQTHYKEIVRLQKQLIDAELHFNSDKFNASVAVLPSIKSASSKEHYRNIFSGEDQLNKLEKCLDNRESTIKGHIDNSENLLKNEDPFKIPKNDNLNELENQISSQNSILSELDNHIDNAWREICDARREWLKNWKAEKNKEIESLKKETGSVSATEQSVINEGLATIQSYIDVLSSVDESGLKLTIAVDKYLLQSKEYIKTIVANQSSGEDVAKLKNEQRIREKNKGIENFKAQLSIITDLVARYEKLTARRNDLFKEIERLQLQNTNVNESCKQISTQPTIVHNNREINCVDIEKLLLKANEDLMNLSLVSGEEPDKAIGNLETAIQTYGKHVSELEQAAKQLLEKQKQTKQEKFTTWQKEILSEVKQRKDFAISLTKEATKLLKPEKSADLLFRGKKPREKEDNINSVISNLSTLENTISSIYVNDFEMRRIAVSHSLDVNDKDLTSKTKQILQGDKNVHTDAIMEHLEKIKKLELSLGNINSEKIKKQIEDLRFSFKSHQTSLAGISIKHWSDYNNSKIQLEEIRNNIASAASGIRELEKDISKIKELIPRFNDAKLKLESLKKVAELLLSEPDIAAFKSDLNGLIVKIDENIKLCEPQNYTQDSIKQIEAAIETIDSNLNKIDESYEIQELNKKISSEIAVDPDASKISPILHPAPKTFKVVPNATDPVETTIISEQFSIDPIQPKTKASTRSELQDRSQEKTETPQDLLERAHRILTALISSDTTKPRMSKVEGNWSQRYYEDINKLQVLTKEYQNEAMKFEIADTENTLFILRELDSAKSLVQNTDSLNDETFAANIKAIEEKLKIIQDYYENSLKRLSDRKTEIEDLAKEINNKIDQLISMKAVINEKEAQARQSISLKVTPEKVDSNNSYSSLKNSLSGVNALYEEYTKYNTHLDELIAKQRRENQITAESKLDALKARISDQNKSISKLKNSEKIVAEQSALHLAIDTLKSKIPSMQNGPLEIMLGENGEISKLEIQVSEFVSSILEKEAEQLLGEQTSNTDKSTKVVGKSLFDKAQEMMKRFTRLYGSENEKLYDSLTQNVKNLVHEAQNLKTIKETELNKADPTFTSDIETIVSRLQILQAELAKLSNTEINLPELNERYEVLKVEVNLFAANLEKAIQDKLSKQRELERLERVKNESQAKQISVLKTTIQSLKSEYSKDEEAWQKVNDEFKNELAPEEIAQQLKPIRQKLNEVNDWLNEVEKNIDSVDKLPRNQTIIQSLESIVNRIGPDINKAEKELDLELRKKEDTIYNFEPITINPKSKPIKQEPIIAKILQDKTNISDTTQIKRIPIEVPGISPEIIKLVQSIKDAFEILKNQRGRVKTKISSNFPENEKITNEERRKQITDIRKIVDPELISPQQDLNQPKNKLENELQKLKQQNIQFTKLDGQIDDIIEKIRKEKLTKERVEKAAKEKEERDKKDNAAREVREREEREARERLLQAEREAKEKAEQELQRQKSKAVRKALEKNVEFQSMIKKLTDQLPQVDDKKDRDNFEKRIEDVAKKFPIDRDYFAIPLENLKELLQKDIPDAEMTLEHILSDLTKSLQKLKEDKLKIANARKFEIIQSANQIKTVLHGENGIINNQNREKYDKQISSIIEELDNKKFDVMTLKELSEYIDLGGKFDVTDYSLAAISRVMRKSQQEERDENSKQVFAKCDNIHTRIDKLISSRPLLISELQNLKEKAKLLENKPLFALLADNGEINKLSEKVRISEIELQQKQQADIIINQIVITSNAISDKIKKLKTLNEGVDAKNREANSVLINSIPTTDVYAEIYKLSIPELQDKLKKLENVQLQLNDLEKNIQDQLRDKTLQEEEKKKAEEKRRQEERKAEQEAKERAEREAKEKADADAKRASDLDLWMKNQNDTLENYKKLLKGAIKDAEQYSDNLLLPIKNNIVKSIQLQQKVDHLRVDSPNLEKDKRDILNEIETFKNECNKIFDILNLQKEIVEIERQLELEKESSEELRGDITIPGIPKRKEPPKPSKPIPPLVITPLFKIEVPGKDPIPKPLVQITPPTTPDPVSSPITTTYAGKRSNKPLPPHPLEYPEFQTLTDAQYDAFKTLYDNVNNVYSVLNAQIVFQNDQVWRPLRGIRQTKYFIESLEKIIPTIEFALRGAKTAANDPNFDYKTRIKWKERVDGLQQILELYNSLEALANNRNRYSKAHCRERLTDLRILLNDQGISGVSLDEAFDVTVEKQLWEDGSQRKSTKFDGPKRDQSPLSTYRTPLVRDTVIKIKHENMGNVVKAQFTYDRRSLTNTKQKKWFNRREDNTDNTKEFESQMKQFVTVAVNEYKKGTPENPIYIKYIGAPKPEAALGMLMELKKRAILENREFHTTFIVKIPGEGGEEDKEVIKKAVISSKLEFDGINEEEIFLHYAMEKPSMAAIKGKSKEFEKQELYAGCAVCQVPNKAISNDEEGKRSMVGHMQTHLGNWKKGHIEKNTAKMEKVGKETNSRTKPKSSL